MKKMLAVMTLIVLIIIAASGCSGNTQAVTVGKNRSARQISSGQNAASGDSAQTEESGEADYTGFKFSTYDIDGNPVNESVFRHDGITMINFWASWCSPCMSELESLQKLSEEGVVTVIGVIVSDTEANCRAAMTQKGVTYTVVVMDANLQSLMGNAIPFSVFYDSEGQMLGSYTGAKSYAQWVTFINGL